MERFLRVDLIQLFGNKHTTIETAISLDTLRIPLLDLLFITQEAIHT